jgi:methylated-DNA-protein-cysteine methyltransferase-like protein
LSFSKKLANHIGAIARVICHAHLTRAAAWSELYMDITTGERTSFYTRVYALVRQVPYGHVVTYGQVAALLGSPQAARAVGYALRVIPPNAGVPWHRVINHRGAISPRYPAQGPVVQRLLLEAEGIHFDAEDRIDLSVYRWQPETAEGNAKS